MHYHECDIGFCIYEYDSDLVVASPVEDYFLYIDDLPEPEKVRIRLKQYI